MNRLKLICHKLFLLESDNQAINLEALLYLLPFKFLSPKHEDVIYLVLMLLQQGLLSKSTPQVLVSLLEREVGCSNVSQKRWKDLIFSERLLFLLRKLDVVCRGNIEHSDKVSIA